MTIREHLGKNKLDKWNDKCQQSLNVKQFQEASLKTKVYSDWFQGKTNDIKLCWRKPFKWSGVYGQGKMYYCAWGCYTTINHSKEPPSKMLKPKSKSNSWAFLCHTILRCASSISIIYSEWIIHYYYVSLTLIIIVVVKQDMLFTNASLFPLITSNAS